MYYNEGIWYAQIPSIVYWEKNEKPWSIEHEGVSYPPLSVANNPVPEKMDSLQLTNAADIPTELRQLGYGPDYASFDLESWNSRKETRLRDKYMKVRIRYTGDNLSIIYAIRTLYTISYV